MTDAEATGHATTLTVVIAADSFKGTAAATEVAEALAAGWQLVRPADDLRLIPMADGGEGTLAAFEMAVPGSLRIPVTVSGPDGNPVATHWLLLPDGTGVIELASTSGLTLLSRLAPLDAQTIGFGEAIAAALDHGVSRLLLAIGGSASTDGGVGALTALGGVFLNAQGAPIAPGGRGLDALASVDLSGQRQLPEGGAIVLSDVTNPLLGEAGAAGVFGPQKGANDADIARLDHALGVFARMVPTDPQLPGAGAAGGTGFGMLLWGASLAPGSSAVGEALGLSAAVASASVVITGEGRFDAQSADGKVASYVLGLASAAGVRAMLVAGAIEASSDAFYAAESLTDLAGSSHAAMKQPLRWLTIAGEKLASAL
ncbi:MAG: glycerate kinase [Homoserinimonas sp.]